jgi:hypothetical protein
MTPVNLVAPRWAVSGRTHGEVLTAGVSTSGLEIVLLGVPQGFTPAEVEGWLHDLSGVAVETSRTDTRERPIPAVLHHALTGLLFSQAELWGRAAASPCSAAFVDGPEGVAFGWVGDGVVTVLVEGIPTEPRWVLVRDENGNEAHATVFAPGQHVVVTLDYWPHGEDGSQAPASIEAVCAPEAVAGESYVPALDAAVEAEQAAALAAFTEVEPEAILPPVVEAAAPEVPSPVQQPVAELPVHLVQQDRPGLRAPIESQEVTETLTHDEVLEAAAMQVMAEAEHASTIEAPAVAEAPHALESAPASTDATEETSAPIVAQEPQVEEAAEPEAPRGAHPVGRWLSRMLGFGRTAAPSHRAPAAEDSEATPLSTYDSILSDAVPALEEPEQTHLELSHDVVELPSVAHLPLVDPSTLQGSSETYGYDAGDEALQHFEAHAPEAQQAPQAEPSVATPQPSQAPQALLSEVHVIEYTEAEPVAFVAPVEDAQPAPVEVAPEVAVAPSVEPAAPVSPTSFGLAPAGLADVLGAAFALPAPEPEPEPEPLEPTFTNDDLLRALSESPLASRITRAEVREDAPAEPSAELAIDREPVGAAPDFAIAPLPGTTPPVVTPTPLPSAPPVMHVELKPYTPSTEEAAELPQPPMLRTPEAPPVLHVHVPAAAAPPMLQLSRPGDAPTAPPVLRVEPQPIPPSVIVPTPPVSPVAPAAAYAPVANAEPAAPVAEASETLEAPAAPPRIQWPQFEDRALESRLWYRRRPVLAAVVVALFGAGWLLGTLATPHGDEPGPFSRALRAVGLGGARFDVSVDSSPPGAWIAVDGKDVAKRTPAKLELKPGKHELTLTLPDLGSAKFPVQGENGAKVTLSPTLAGALEVVPADPNVPITVGLDGRSQGYAPITIEKLAPGLHEVQFSGPGMAPWAQNIQVGVGKTVQLVARPMSAPGTGVLQVQATINDDEGASPLSGAQVFVDGASRGVTPVSLELPRGPHSVKVVYRNETAAIQVIDLPGGNQRFASFDFGLATPAPQVSIVGTSRVMSATQTNMVSAAFSGLGSRDLREAWLHVRSAEGLWRRYPMTPVTSPGVTMMAAVFPQGVYDATGRTIWYVSATAVQGDEYFSEMQPAWQQGAKGAPAGATRATP